MALVDLRTTHNPRRYLLPLEPRVCVGAPESLFLFGGAGLAAAIAAMEAATGRPTVWATAQYLAYARPPAILDLDVLVPVAGKHSSQARVVGHVADTEILTVNAALGSRPETLSVQWATMPDVPPPLDCPPMRENWRRADDDIQSHMEKRVAKGRFGADRTGGADGDGHALLWIRQTNPQAVVDRIALAVFADMIPSGIGSALGRQAGGNSLDNTLRIVRLVPTEWVLCDIRIHGLHAGFAHGRMLMYAEDGTLLATASQSMIARIHDEG